VVGWPIADTLPTKWSHVNHRSGVDQGKFDETDALTTEPRRQPATAATVALYVTG